MNSNYRHIAIEGNIGAGKTTLARLLAARTGSGLLLESFDDNPFLPKFYTDPERYGLTLELSFLEERFRHQADVAQQQPLLADYLWEKSYVFAAVTLSGAEWELFQRYYRLLAGRLLPPDLVIYLHRDTARLQQQIGSRGRSYEQAIPDNYLDKVGASYQQFFGEEQRMPILWIEENGNSTASVEQLADQLLPMTETLWSNGLHRISI